MKAVQKKRADSLETVRKYKNSKRYTDSVTRVRQARLDSMKTVRMAVSDSMRQERQRVLDSTVTARKHFSDSVKRVSDSTRAVRMAELEILKAERQKRSDSLAAIRKYRESKVYKDSVATVRQARMDSIIAERKKYNDSVKVARKAVNDSIIAERRRVTDSMIAERKRTNDSVRTSLDSIRAERTRMLDSMAVVRKARADSLAEVREKRELAKAEKEKEKEKKNKLALEIKFEEDKKQYSNEKFRKKRWSVPRRVVQNTFTRYNYYFNADARMDEAIDNMVRSKQDNYDSLLALFPFDPDIDSAKLSSDMDTIIRKSSLGIYIHDPRSKWQDDLYLLVGQAYYYKGDYENAALAFRFIISEAEKAEREKEKRKNKNKKDQEIKPATFASPPKKGIAKVIGHNEAKNHAMLWLSRTLAQDHQTGLAQTLLDMLRNDANFPEKDKGRLATEQAFVDLKKHDYSNATHSLTTVANDNDLPKWLRLRAAYLNGQLLQQDKNFDKSTDAFKKSLALHPSVDMAFNAQKHIAFNSVNGEGDPNEALKILTRMSQDQKYKAFYDQIYYGLGLIAKKLEKPSEEIIENYRKSIQLGTNNNRQKGLSYMALGDEYYKLLNYNLAKQSYDSAGMLLTQQDQPEWTIANQRASVLDKIAEPGNTVKETDSLIYLASLSEAEQRTYIDRYIKDLEKWIADSTFQAQNAPPQMQSMNMNQGSSGASWYFSNPTLMKKGANDFKQKWGDIKLKDNWRRSLAGFGDGGSGDGNIAAEEEDIISRIPHPDTLLAAIPKGEELDSVKHANNIALFELGKGYYYDLEDNDNAVKTFDTLQARYPKHNEEAEELYIRYLIAVRSQNQNEAGRYYDELQQNYSTTEWAKRLKESKDRLQAQDELWVEKEQTLSEHYSETYDILIERNYTKAISRSDEAPALFNNLGSYRNKYELVRATAIAGLGKYNEADTLLQVFIARNPGDSLLDWANTVWEYVKKNKFTDSLQNAQQDNNRDSLSKNANTGGEKKTNNSFKDYAVDKDAKHYVLIIAALDAKLTALKSGLSDYHAMTSGKENITVSMTNMETGIGVILCKEFDNAIKAKNYINEITLNKNIFREYEDKRTFSVVSISENNFQKLFVKKDTKEYIDFWKKNYK